MQFHSLIKIRLTNPHTQHSHPHTLQLGAHLTDHLQYSLSRHRLFRTNKITVPRSLFTKKKIIAVLEVAKIGVSLKKIQQTNAHPVLLTPLRECSLQGLFCPPPTRIRSLEGQLAAMSPFIQNSKNPTKLDFPQFSLYQNKKPIAHPRKIST